MVSSRPSSRYAPCLAALLAVLIAFPADATCHSWRRRLAARHDNKGIHVDEYGFVRLPGQFAPGIENLGTVAVCIKLGPKLNDAADAGKVFIHILKGEWEKIEPNARKALKLHLELTKELEKRNKNKLLAPFRSFTAMSKLLKALGKFLEFQVMAGCAIASYKWQEGKPHADRVAELEKLEGQAEKALEALLPAWVTAVSRQLVKNTMKGITKSGIRTSEALALLDEHCDRTFGDLDNSEGKFQPPPENKVKLANNFNLEVFRRIDASIRERQPEIAETVRRVGEAEGRAGGAGQLEN